MYLQPYNQMSRISEVAHLENMNSKEFEDSQINKKISTLKEPAP